MKKISLKLLMQMGIIMNISCLRTNVNGFPYVTMLVTGSDGKTNSQNVYFGKKTGAAIGDSFAVGDNVVPALIHSEVIQTLNKDSEVRFKLSTNAGSDYASEVELANAFGLELKAGEFDTELFRKGFDAAPVKPVKKNAPAQQ